MSIICALFHKIRMILNSFIAKILLLDKIFCNIIKEFGKDNFNHKEVFIHAEKSNGSF